MERPKDILHDVVNLCRCIGELTVLYAQEKLRDFETMLDDAEDVWGDDE